MPWDARSPLSVLLSHAASIVRYAASGVPVFRRFAIYAAWTTLDPPSLNSKSDCASMFEWAAHACRLTGISMPRRQRSLLLELVKVIVGGMFGIALAVLVAWYGFGRDPLGIFAPPPAGRQVVSDSKRDNDRASRPQSNQSRKVQKPNSAKGITPSVTAAELSVTPKVIHEPPADLRTPKTAVDATPSAPTNARHPPPDGTTYERKLREVRDIFNEEYASATTPEKQAALAESMLSFADKAEGDPNGRFVVIREALVMASQAGDLELGEKAIDQLVEKYELDEPLMRAYFFLGTLANLRTNEDRKQSAEESLALIPEVVELRQLNVARNLATMAQALGVATKGRAEKQLRHF